MSRLKFIIAIGAVWHHVGYVLWNLPNKKCYIWLTHQEIVIFGFCREEKNIFHVRGSET